MALVNRFWSAVLSTLWKGAFTVVILTPEHKIEIVSWLIRCFDMVPFFLHGI